MSAGAWRTALRWAPSVGVAATIFVLSSIPGTAFPVIQLDLADKLVHAVVYALLAASLAWPLSRMSAGKRVIAVTLIACLYGVSDELHQRFTPHRSSDGWDVVADTIGALLGALAFAAIARWRRSR